MSINKNAYPAFVGPIEDENGAMPDRGRGNARERAISEPVRDGVTTPQYSPFSDIVSTQPESANFDVGYDAGAISPVSSPDVDGTPYEENLSSDGETAKDKKFQETGIKIFDSKDEAVAEFLCDVAKTYEQKVAGLQVYDTLLENNGLLFEYKYAQDVLYHMGTVKFPIDIIFIDGENKIKKICRNIKPGDVSLFGCGNVKTVLEIPGGLSDRLGISSGNMISVNENNSKLLNLNKVSKNLGYKNSIIKYSSAGKNKFYNWNDHSILQINNTFVKNAENTKLAASLTESLPNSDKKIAAFYIDNFSRDNNYTAESFIDISEELFRMSKNSSYKTILLTNNDVSQLKKISSVIDYTVNGLNVLGEIKIVKVAKDIDYVDIINYIEKEYNNNEYRIYADESLLKNAGVPVPNSTKKCAKEILALLESAELNIEKSKNNLNKNLEQYTAYKNDPKEVAATSGQFSESSKRNVKIIKEYLISIRDVINKLNQIKDISTTYEIIDTLADSAKECAEAAESIFDLVSTLDSSEFLQNLDKNTKFYDNKIENLLSALDRAKEYVSVEILGIIILSN